MKKNLTIIFAVLLAFIYTANGQTPGTLDPSFGAGGKVVYDRDQTDLYNDVQVQTDGRIVAAGTSMTPTYTAVIEVTRYLADGTFDPSFGTGGHFNYTYNGNPETMAYRCLIKTNGKILIAGHTTDYTTWGILLIQLNSDGTPDPAFGTNGVVYQNFTPGECAAFGLALQSDNKILISGYKQNAGFSSVPYVARFSAAGVLDASFGTGGVAEVSVITGDNDFSAVCVQTDGKILAAGHYNSGPSWFTLLLARFDQNGILDPTYGNAGVVNMNLDNVDDEFFDMEMSGNDCVLTGFTVTQSDITYHLLLMKFDQNGLPVASFGDGGKVIWGNVDYTFGDALEIQDDGKIVIAGCTGGLQPANNDWALWRFNADGSIDNTFGNNGITTTEFFGHADEALGVALWEDKIIVAGKTRNATDYLDFAVAKYRNSFTAAFTISNDTICNGSTVQFTDHSLGAPTAWNWTFEGGTPSTSTDQNPLVTYLTPGVYDVTLVITKGAMTNTSSNPDMIHVESPITIAPATPTGPTEICGSFNYDYTTTAVPGATSYNWTVNPSTAGSISGTDITGTLAASNIWSGAYTVKVSGLNSCGSGLASPELNGILTHQPIAYSLFSGGGYCIGTTGYEIKLEDSETGVDYQLYKDGIASGDPLPGTGNMLSFGNQTVGVYNVTGVNGICGADMLGVSTNYIIDPPAAASLPAGPAATCNNISSTFTGVLPANGFSLVWTLDPPAAGTISQPTLTTALVTWSPEFSGSAAVTVQGQNECGEGPSSPAHTIIVNPLPVPAVSGITSVCKTQEITYTTTSNTGSTYAWAVSGGTISSGQGSNQVTVVWGNPGTGTVSVTETSDEGCAGTSELINVAIDECTGISENQANALNIYPNPVTDQLTIAFNLETKSNATVIIYNHMGQVVYQSNEIKAGNKQAVKVDVTQFIAGTYTIQLRSGNEIHNTIFIKK
jgi:uncharacterized delta-60 repeat protein